jgi:hypothetical protein
LLNGETRAKIVSPSRASGLVPDVGELMTDKTETETDTKRGDRLRTTTRRFWHAPQFISTDIASTDTQGSGGHDGGPTGSAS